MNATPNKRFCWASPPLRLILVIVFWGISSGFVRLLIQDGMDGHGVILLAGAVIIAAFSMALLRLGVQNFWVLFRNYRAASIKLVGPGLLAFFLYPICYFYGISGPSYISANVLNYLWPAATFFAVALMDRRKKLAETEPSLQANPARKDDKWTEKIAPMNAIALVMAIAGTFFVLWKDGFENHLISALGGGVVYGIYSALIRRDLPSVAGKVLSSFERIAVMLFFGAVPHLLVLCFFLAGVYKLSEGKRDKYFISQGFTG